MNPCVNFKTERESYNIIFYNLFIAKVKNPLIFARRISNFRLNNKNKHTVCDSCQCSIHERSI